MHLLQKFCFTVPLQPACLRAARRLERCAGAQNTHARTHADTHSLTHSLGAHMVLYESRIGSITALFLFSLLRMNQC